ISRAHYMAQHGCMGDPMFSKEFSPFFAAMFIAAPGSQLLGFFTVPIQAAYVTWLPVNDIYAIRLASFTWTLIAAFLTYLLARKTGMKKEASFLAVILTIAVP